MPSESDKESKNEKSESTSSETATETASESEHDDIGNDEQESVNRILAEHEILEKTNDERPTGSGYQKDSEKKIADKRLKRKQKLDGKGKKRWENSRRMSAMMGALYQSMEKIYMQTSSTSEEDDEGENDTQEQLSPAKTKQLSPAKKKQLSSDTKKQLSPAKLKQLRSAKTAKRLTPTKSNSKKLRPAVKQQSPAKMKRKHGETTVSAAESEHEVVPKKKREVETEQEIDDVDIDTTVNDIQNTVSLHPDDEELIDDEYVDDGEYEEMVDEIDLVGEDETPGNPLLQTLADMTR